MLGALDPNRSVRLFVGAAQDESSPVPALTCGLLFNLAWAALHLITLWFSGPLLPPVTSRLASHLPPLRQGPPLCTLPSSRSASGHKHLLMATNIQDAELSPGLLCKQEPLSASDQREAGTEGTEGNQGQHEM